MARMATPERDDQPVITPGQALSGLVQLVGLAATGVGIAVLYGWPVMLLALGAGLFVGPELRALLSSGRPVARDVRPAWAPRRQGDRPVPAGPPDWITDR